MDLAELHAPWRDGKEISRLCPVSNDLSFNVLMPAFYWTEFDRLATEGWAMEGCYRLCWQDALAYDGLAIEGGRYEIFRRYLREAILLFRDGDEAVKAGRANDNMEHKSCSWSRRGQMPA